MGFVQFFLALFLALYSRPQIVNGLTSPPEDVFLAQGNPNVKIVMCHNCAHCRDNLLDTLFNLLAYCKLFFLTPDLEWFQFRNLLSAVCSQERRSSATHPQK